MAQKYEISDRIAPYPNPTISALSPSDSISSNFTLLYKSCREISNDT
ncbi:MAG: hypothetical protein ACYTXA_32520 [Nostoc sp.]